RLAGLHGSPCARLSLSRATANPSARSASPATASAKATAAAEAAPADRATAAKAARSAAEAGGKSSARGKASSGSSTERAARAARCGVPSLRRTAIRPLPNVIQASPGLPQAYLRFLDRRLPAGNPGALHLRFCARLIDRLFADLPILEHALLAI